MKYFVILLLLTGMIGCASSRISVPSIHIPEMHLSPVTDDLYLQGWQELRLGRAREAMDKFQLSNAAKDLLHVAFAYVFLLQEKYSLARQNLDKALALNPDSREAALGLIIYHDIRGEPLKTFALARALLGHWPDNAWLRVRHASLKSSITEDYMKAAAEARLGNRRNAYIEALEEAARYSPEISALRLEIADFYRSEGDYESALPHLEAVAGGQLQREEALMKLAEAYENLQRVDQALLIYHQLQELRPADQELENRVAKLKDRFRTIDLPQRFKNIYFKENLNREDLAALIGHYFTGHLELSGMPIIITDIGGSYAREDIVKVVTAGIMEMRPDHTFDRFTPLSRAGTATVLYKLYSYLDSLGALAAKLPMDPESAASDILPIHRDYEIISFVVRRDLLKLDETGNFNPTQPVSPGELLLALNRILSVVSTR